MTSDWRAGQTHVVGEGNRAKLLAGRRKLLIETAGNTVSRTVSSLLGPAGPGVVQRVTVTDRVMAVVLPQLSVAISVIV